MALSDVVIVKGNGGLGRRNPSTDGISGFITTGIAVPGKLVLSTTYKLQGMPDVEALGLNQAYDVTNGVLVFAQLAEMFRLNPNITLYFMLASQDSDMLELVSPTANIAPKLMADADNTIVQLAIGFNPPLGYTAVMQNGIDSQVLLTIAQAQLLTEYADTIHAPLSAVLIEGYGFGGNVTAAVNLRTLTSNKVTVVIAQDASAPEAITKPKHAAVGAYLAMVSLANVNENVGWPEKFILTDAKRGKWLKAGLSGGTVLTSFTNTQLNQLDDKAFVFARSIPQLPGLYFTDSHTCTTVADDYSRLEFNRTMDKAIKAVRSVLVAKLKSPLQVDAETGFLKPVTVADFETLAQAELNFLVRDAEISAAEVYINPAQNVLANGTLEVEVDIVPTGSAHTIRVKIGFTNPFKN